MDVSSWLRDLGLEDYCQAFRAHHIDAATLSRLTAEDLIALGVTSIGHRRKLLDAIAALRGGTASTAAAPRSAAPVRPTKAERRQLTVAFCDLVGSTELATRLDPEDLRAVMAAYHRCTAAVIERFEGHVAKYLGDGVLAYFGWPRAHEDDAERAVRAGLTLVEAIARLEPQADVRLRGRIGIATGQVVVGDLVGAGASRDEAVVGEVPNLAARLQALAKPGAVVISQATRRLVGGLFELDDLGPQRLKGFAEPLVAWRVVGEGRAEGRFEARQTTGLTPLVGREEEIALLVHLWRQATNGAGQVVLLAGEPGIGKSRLIRELRERIAAEPHVRLIHQCSSYHQTSPLHPVIEHLERAAGFARDDPPEARLAKLETMLARGTDQLKEAVPLIAALLGVTTGEPYPALDLTPQRQKQLTLEALMDQLVALAAEQPVLMIHEDVHWIDPTTQELLGLTIERIAHLPVLMIVTFRPDFTPPWPRAPHVRTLALTRLGLDDGSAIVDRVVGEKALPAEVSAQIVAKTDGVPLFVEELTKTVLESGLLRDAGNRYELTGPLPPLAIPSTLHDSLMARLDRLAPAKELAQIGAALGREFSHALLAALAPLPEAEFNAALDQLVSSELIFRRGTPPEAIYSFKHVLVQDAAYGTLLKSRRQQLHARIVQVLEERFPDTAESRPDLLAHHCTEAGLVNRAVDYWYKAGRQAMVRSAMAEAIAQLRRGLRLLADLPDGPARRRQELDLQTALGGALITVEGYGASDVREAYGRALELCQQIGKTGSYFSALRGIWNWHLLRADLNTSTQLARQLLDIAHRENDSDALLASYRALGSTLMFMGNFAEARAYLERGLSFYRTERHRSYVMAFGEDPGVICHLYTALCSDGLGHRDKARRMMDEAMAHSRQLGHPFSLAFALSISQLLYMIRGEPEPVEQMAAEAASLCSQQGFAQWAAHAVFTRGWVSFALDRKEKGLAEMRQGLESWRATGAVLMTAYWLTNLAGSLSAAGMYDAAKRSAEEALSIMNQTDHRYFEPEAHRLLGTAAWIADHDEVTAVTCLDRALASARRQNARVLELRAATSLARLLAEQSRRAEARDLLAPVYGWFTEGFDTADLTSAKALLAELA